MMTYPIIINDKLDVLLSASSFDYLYYKNFIIIEVSKTITQSILGK